MRKEEVGNPPEADKVDKLASYPPFITPAEGLKPYFVVGEIIPVNNK